MARREETCQQTKPRTPWDGAPSPPDGASRSHRPHRRPALSVRAVDGTAHVEIINAETFYAEADISRLADQLHSLAEGGHTRLVR